MIFFMRILPIDEIPEQYKKEINNSWLTHYSLFAEEISRTKFLLQDSLEKSIHILTWIQGFDFPYQNLKVWKPTVAHLRKINIATHLWVLVMDHANVIYLVEWILDMSLVQNQTFSDIPNFII